MVPSDLASSLAPTPVDVLDACLVRLSDRKKAWQQVDRAQRCTYLRAGLAGLETVAEAWVESICGLKGIAPSDPLVGEEWLSGPIPTARMLRHLLATLSGETLLRPPHIARRTNGQSVVSVFPTFWSDRLLLPGFTGEVWIEPGHAPTQGASYGTSIESSGRSPIGGVTLVLGAGNVSSIPPLDVLHQLFVENRTVLLKMNPVNERVGPLLERAFQTLINDGFLAIVYGGAEIGAYLAEHPLVDTLHVTGSHQTYDAIVWGSDPAQQAQRRAANEPRNARPFTAELGCVTPVLVVPGPWSNDDLAFQARHVAAMVVQNASFNCNAAKVVVTARGWDKRAAFLHHLTRELTHVAPRRAYYPGAQSRYEAFLGHYPNAQVLGRTGKDVVPWTLLPDVPARPGEYALNHEAFCGVLADVALDAEDPRSFFRAATTFANDLCWGTLSCALLVHPATARAYAEELDAALADLRYGAIAVNAWPALVYALGCTTWGAFPGHTREDIRSGTGVVHNTFLLDFPQKSVVRAPFRIRPTPVWFADNRALVATSRNLFRAELAPSWSTIPPVVWAALGG